MSIRTQNSFCCFLCALLLAAPVCWAQESESGVNRLSITSLELKILHNDVEIGSATGFVLEKGGKHYLVTNRHVVLACTQDQSPADVGGWLCANKLSIYHNRLNRFGEWFWVVEDLLDGHGNKGWLEHPTLGAAADIVALPLQHADDVQFYPLDLELRKTDIVVAPGDAVSIVGFPFGLAQGGGRAIWKTGTIASDLDFNYRGKPMFLLDTTSRPGMSGSPVFAVRNASFVSSGGALMYDTRGAKRFLGVYSEQMQAAEIGAVWKAEVIKTLYDSLP